MSDMREVANPIEDEDTGIEYFLFHLFHVLETVRKFNTWSLAALDSYRDYVDQTHGDKKSAEEYKEVFGEFLTEIKTSIFAHLLDLNTKYRKDGKDKFRLKGLTV